MRLIITALLLALTVAGEEARFDNYRVHRVIPRTESQVKALRALELSSDYDFWTATKNVGFPTDVMVPPHKRAEFDEFINKNRLEQEIQIENVQSLVEEEESLLRSRNRNMEWTNYHSLDEIYKWLDALAAKHPQNVKVIVGGSSYEKREIRGIEITFGNNFTGVFVESGIHAREWIAPAGTTWMIEQILNGKVDPVFKRFNYLYFPVYNPDGYVYSWTKSRMWRKTRTPYTGGGRQCYGADPNRNWDFHWGEVGCSKDPCSETYCGPKPFSEVEMKSMSEFVNKVAKSKKLDIFLCYHSFGQMILYPWGYTSAPSKNDAIFSKVGVAAGKALNEVHGTRFKVGRIATTIYKVSGSSLEWYYDKFNSTLSYVYEMRDTGTHGFLLPPRYIIPVGEEHLAAFKSTLLEYEQLKK